MCVCGVVCSVCVCVCVCVCVYRTPLLHVECISGGHNFTKKQSMSKLRYAICSSRQGLSHGAQITVLRGTSHSQL